MSSCCISFHVKWLRRNMIYRKKIFEPFIHFEFQIRFSSDNSNCLTKFVWEETRHDRFFCHLTKIVLASFLLTCEIILQFYSKPNSCFGWDEWISSDFLISFFCNFMISMPSLVNHNTCFSLWMFFDYFSSPWAFFPCIQHKGGKSFLK